MLFCSQIIFAPILINIHNALMRINENYIVAELDNTDSDERHVLTQINCNIISTTKILRIVDISNNNSIVSKFLLHFTINYKTSDFLMLKIEFLDV
jgi:hypothetical protein